MTGSYLASGSLEMAGVVAMWGDYRGSGVGKFWRLWCLRSWHHFGGAQIFFHGDFEIHQFVAFRVAHSHEVETGSGEGVCNVLNIKKKKTAHGGVGFDCFGAELSSVDFIPGLAAYAAFDFFLGEWNWQRYLPIVP